MIALEPVHLQIAGIGILVALAVAMGIWAVRAAMGLHRGWPVYVLPDTTEEDDEDLGDESHGG